MTSDFSAVPVLGGVFSDLENERVRKWQTEATSNHDRAVLDWDGFMAGKTEPRLDFAPDKETARRDGLIYSFLQIQNGGRPLPEDVELQDVYRDQVADAMFEGRGKGDAGVFFGEIQKSAQARKDTTLLLEDATRSAATSALMEAAGEPVKDYASWIAEARKRQGYRGDLESALLSQWQERRRALVDEMEPVRELIGKQWAAMKEGKHVDLGGLDDLMGDEHQRDVLASAIGSLVKELPKDKQPGVMANLRKQFLRRDLRMNLKGLEGAMKPFDQHENLPAEYLDQLEPGMNTEKFMKAKRDDFDRDKRLRERFVRRLDSIVNDEYDPITTFAKEGSGWAAVERGLYMLPSVGLTAAVASTPGIGQHAMLEVLRNESTDAARASLVKGGMSEDQADEVAEVIGTAAAVVQLPMEFLGLKGMTHRLPIVNKAVEKLTQNLATRFFARGLAGGAVEFTTEMGQNLVPYILQDVAAAASQDMPDTQWTGKGGVFDGYGNQSLEVLGAVLPFSMIMAGGGVTRDIRLRAYAETPDIVKRASGLTDEAIAAVNSAQGIAAQERAIQAAWETRDINSEAAKAAQAELTGQVRAQQAAATNATDNGILPRAERGADGTWMLYDTVTGDEVGKASDWRSAADLATAHANFSGDLDADRIAAVFSTYQAAEASGEWSRAVGRQTDTNLDLGTSLTTEDFARESERTRARIEAQERLDGGDGSFARQVFGQSRTDFAENQIRTVNRILEGGSVLDVFHEEAHGMRRTARKLGTLTRDDDVAFLRAVSAVLRSAKTRKGVTNEAGEATLDLVPDNFDALSVPDQDVVIDEGISRIMEAEVIRTRKGGGQRELPAGVISNNLSALSRLLGDKTLGKFRSFINSMREYFGLAVDRATAIQRGLADGTLDRNTYEGYLAKLYGIEEQHLYDQMARDAEAEILAGVSDADAVDEGDPFSIGRAEVTPTTATRVFPGADGSPSVVGPASFSIRAFHGTPHKVDRFTTDKMGTGEGAQAYGWGLYFAEAEAVAKEYRRILGLEFRLDGEVLMRSGNAGPKFAELKEALGPDAADIVIAYLDQGNQRVYDELRDPENDISEDVIGLALDYLHRIESTDSGNLYKVTLKAPENELLDWDAPMDGQPAAVQAALRSAFGDIDAELTAGEWYREQSNAWAPTTAIDPETLSRKLLAAGVRGIRYFDGDSRAWKVQLSTSKGPYSEASFPNRQVAESYAAEKQGEGFTASVFQSGTRNYVIFDEADIEILEENGQPVAQGDSSFSLGKARDIFQSPDLAGSPSSYEFTDAQLPIRDRESLESQGLHSPRGAYSPELDSRVRDFERNAGVRVRAFRESGGSRNDTGRDVVGFVHPDNPVTIFVNADIDFPVGATLAHEWLHCLSHDPAKASLLNDFEVAVTPLLIPAQVAQYAQALRGAGYEENQLKAELLGNLFGDAVTGSDAFLTSLVTSDSAAVLAAAEDIWEKANPLSPSGLKEAPDEALSLGSGRLGILTADAIRRIKDPLRRAQAMEVVSRKLDNLRLDAERLELLAGAKRAKRSLSREAAIRQALRQEELENEVWGRHSHILSDDDLVKITAQPVHAFLKDPKNPLRGRLLSKSAAIKLHPDLFKLQSSAEYDGSEKVSRTVFGGTLAPDLAAQEMYEVGLIRQPTTDALWQALESEAQSVAGMKKLLQIAKAELKEAKTQAKHETNEWLASQTDKQEAHYSPRQEVLRTLAALDAILSSVPPAIRGKVGGYVQAARIANPESALEFLRERLRKADHELERWLRDQYNTEFHALLDRAKPQKSAAGEKPKGKITPELHVLFDEIREGMRLTAQEAENRALELESYVRDGIQQTDGSYKDLTPAEQSHATILANMLRLVGGWNKASAAQRGAAVVEATRIFQEGYSANLIEVLKVRERRANGRKSLKVATGKTGAEKGRKAMEEEAKTFTGRIKQGFLSVFGYEQMMHWAFGEKSTDAERLIEMQFHADNRKEDALQRYWDGIEELFIREAGGRGKFDKLTENASFKGQKLRARLAEVRQDVDSKGNAQTPAGIKASNGVHYSELQAITATLMWQQDKGRAHMIGHVDDQGKPNGEWHYGQDFIDSLEAGLSDEAKAVRLFLMEQYAGEWDLINPTFRKLNGVNLPREKNYSPLCVAPVQGANPADYDPVTGSFTGGAGFTPSSLRNRGEAIARPDFRDALTIFEGHVMQIQHWIAYAEFTAEADAMLNHRDVQSSVTEKAGGEAVTVLKKWVEFFGKGGTNDAAAHIAATKETGGALNRLAAATLAGRVSVLAIQSLQLGAANYSMPTASYIKRSAKLFTGQLGWGAAIGSSYIQRRVKQMPPIVRAGLAGLTTGTPNQIKHQAARLAKLIGGADALFTAGTYAMIYDYQLKVEAKRLGLKGAEAEAFAHAAAERETDRVAQPTRAGAKSLFENISTSPFMRLGWAFASEPRQKLARMVYEVVNKPLKQKAKAVLLTYLYGGVLASILRAALRDIRDDGDDDEVFDERNWNPAVLSLQAFTSPIKGIPYLGDGIEGAIFGFTGQYLPEGNLFSAPTNAAKAAANTPKWVSGERDVGGILKDTEAMLFGLAAGSETASGVTSFSHIIRDAFGIAENAAGDE